MNLKDEYTKEFIIGLANQLNKEDASFNKNSFIKSILNPSWETKELKERMRCVTENIHTHLPISYPKQINVLSKIVHQHSRLTSFVFPDFVQVYGLNDYKTSIKALELFTQYSTAEFAIRPFIEKYPKETMQQMLSWSNHKNEHLRRLASEGTRPKLPWASPLRAFIKDPSPALPILENLKNDPSLYVRKSVANHLNDISKNHPDLVLKIGKQWHGKTAHTNWIIKQALRTLLKKGDKKALAIFGLHNSQGIEIDKLKLSQSEINIGDFIYFEFEVLNETNEKRDIRIEYSIDFVKANGSSSGKVFQLSEFELKPKTQKAFKRKQWFKELSTRKHYPGKHKISLIVNGDEKTTCSIKLLK
jgi:3-methyladenine DNA glycosylase AlkC